ncbi:MAG: hypothetical protein ABW116_15085 [Candidatus Sedimenticola sp. 20ELBAFRAG]
MNRTKRFLVAAMIAGTAAIAPMSADAWWWPGSGWGGPWGGGPWGGGPWGGYPYYGGGYPYYGGYPGWGVPAYGLPGYGYGYPYATVPQAPTTTEDKE